MPLQATVRKSIRRVIYLNRIVLMLSDVSFLFYWCVCPSPEQILHEAANLDLVLMLIFRYKSLSVLVNVFCSVKIAFICSELNDCLIRMILELPIIFWTGIQNLNHRCVPRQMCLEI